MKASVLSFQAAVLFLVVGMVWGLVMAISNDHSAMPAHAHLILLGWDFSLPLWHLLPVAPLA